MFSLSTKEGKQESSFRITNNVHTHTHTHIQTHTRTHTLFFGRNIVSPGLMPRGQRGDFPLSTEPRKNGTIKIRFTAGSTLVRI